MTIPDAGGSHMLNPLEAPRRAPGRDRPLALLLPLYAVIFVGFAGYSLMITVFTPMLLRSDSPLISAGDPIEKRTIILGVLLCLYPLGQFLGSPILGGLSDRFGRKPVLLISLAFTTVCYALIALSLTIESLSLLAIILFLAGLSEANVVAAQSAIADVCPPAGRNPVFWLHLHECQCRLYRRTAGGRQTGRSQHHAMV